MNIGLIDIDNTGFPNLTLMKLSAHYKRQGYNVDMLSIDDILKGIPLFTNYSHIFGACVFDKNRDIAIRLREQGVIVHGSGIDNKTLPEEIERECPDYSLYGINDTAYGFLTRGCPRKCPFCIVASKEGTISQKVADLSQFWSGQRYIKLLDPNLLACSERIRLIKQLVDSKAQIDFTQGLDIRLINDEIIDLLNVCKVKMIHFAWDNPRDVITKELLLKFRRRSKVQDERKLKVYVLTNYWSTHQEDLERVYWLRDNGYDPYVMIYDKPHAPKQTRYLQRWVNNKIIFRTVDNFEQYDHKIG